MPAKDLFHDTVRNALEKDGWNVKDDPLHLKWGKRDFYVALAASRFYLADRGEQHIAVEIKGFTGVSPMFSLEQTLGQFLIYRSILKRKDPLRKLYLAVDQKTFRNVFQKDVGPMVIEDYDIALIVFNSIKEVIVEWRP
jgi:hypothetical protein